MLKNSIILQDVTLEQLTALISKGVKDELQGFTKQLNIPNSETLLTRDEACEFLKINSSTLWAWSNKKRVKAYGIGSRIYYKKSELMEALKLKK